MPLKYGISEKYTERVTNEQILNIIKEIQQLSLWKCIPFRKYKIIEHILRYESLLKLI